MPARSLLRPMLLVLALTSWLPPAAEGAWSDSRRIGATGEAVRGIAFAPSGRALLTLTPLVGRPWRATAGTAARGFASPFRLTRRRESLSVLDPEAVAVLGRDGYVVGGTRTGPPDEPVLSRPWVRLGRIGASPGPTAWSGRRGDQLVSVAANARGDAAVLTASCAACLRSTLRLVLRGSGGAFARPVRVTGGARIPGEDGGGFGPSLAVGPAGDVAVAWTTAPSADGSQRARARLWRAARWRGPAQDLGPALPFGEAVIRLDARGRAVVAWSAQPGVPAGEETEITGPPTFWAAATPTDGRFRDPVRLGAGVVTGPDQWLPDSNHLDVELEPGGHGLVGWTGVRAGRQVVRVRRLERGLPGTIQALGAGTFADLDLVPGGGAAVAWTNEGALRVSASAAGKFPPHGASVAALAEPRPQAAVAVDPVTRRVVAAWTRRVGLSPTARYAVRSPLPR